MEENQTSNNEVILESNKAKKKHGFLYYFLNILLWGVIAAGIIYSGLNVIDQKTGYTFLPSHTCVIVSGSMSNKNPVNTYLDENDKQIQINDVISTTNYKSYEEITYKDVILYMGEDGIPVCHRVLDKYESNGNYYIVCRGDANNTSDLPVNYNRVRGKVTNVISGIGVVIRFFQSVYFLIALFFAGFFIFLGMFIAENKKDKALKTSVTTNSETTKPVEEIKPTPQEIKMISLKCPKCGTQFSSEVSESYKCPNCGVMLRAKKKEEPQNEEK